MKLFNTNSCICCDSIKGSKWNKCLKKSKCPKESKIKGHNVLSANSGNMSRKMRNSRRLRANKFSRALIIEGASHFSSIRVNDKNQRDTEIDLYNLRTDLGYFSSG